MIDIVYKNKKPDNLILTPCQKAVFDKPFNMSDNNLIFGENLAVLKTLLYDCDLKGKIDLIYIDPPFATNTIFKINASRTATISIPQDGDIAYTDTLNGADFLEFLRERLLFAKELLSDKGSIYLHIDYKIGHYVKIMMDEIFGMDNFKNDITRIKCNPKNFHRKAYGNIKDMILFYSKTNNNIWNNPTTSYTKSDIEKLFPKESSDGRKYTTVPLHAPGETKNGATAQPFKGILPPNGRHWRSSPDKLKELDMQGLIEWSLTNNPRKIVYADEKTGKKMQDIWDFKDPSYPNYPTQKNIDLLKTIIQASSEPDSIILDFFSGSGTTLSAAQQLNRQWIGIDQSPHAINVIQSTLSQQETLYTQKHTYITTT